jgi:hypothetical protein
MKTIIATILCVISMQAFAESKYSVCMDAAMAAGFGYDVKQQGGQMPRLSMKNVDMVHAAIVKQSMQVGYKARSYEEAIRAGNEKCVKSPMWAK